MSKHASPTVVGGFVLAGLALAITMIALFGGGRFFRDTARVIVFFDGSVNGLRIGAPVKFRGIEIGAVKDVRISMSGALREPSRVRIPVVLELDADRLSAEGVGHVDLHDGTHLQTLVAQGLRAQLDTESFVTGVRYVSLDIRPDVPPVLENERGVPYPEIPSMRGAMDQVPDKLDHVLARLAELDVGRISASIVGTAEEARALLGSPHLRRAIESLDGLAAKLQGTVVALGDATRAIAPAAGEMTQTVRATRELVSPDGVLASRTSGALKELESAARSLRRLADHIDRDPGALLRGGRQ